MANAIAGERLFLRPYVTKELCDAACRRLRIRISSDSAQRTQGAIRRGVERSEITLRSSEILRLPACRGEILFARFIWNFEFGYCNFTASPGMQW